MSARVRFFVATCFLALLAAASAEAQRGTLTPREHIRVLPRLRLEARVSRPGMLGGYRRFDAGRDALDRARARLDAARVRQFAGLERMQERQRETLQRARARQLELGNQALRRQFAVRDEALRRHFTLRDNTLRRQLEVRERSLDRVRDRMMRVRPLILPRRSRII